MLESQQLSVASLNGKTKKSNRKNIVSSSNGWADMFNEYVGSGVPRNIDPGCAYGGVMTSNGGTFTCTFGTESSSNDTNNRILIRWKLTSGQSITAMSFTST